MSLTTYLREHYGVSFQMGREEVASHASLRMPIPDSWTVMGGVDCAPSYALYGSTVLNQVACFLHSHSLHARLSPH
jgi:hypothetical protein